MVRQIEKRKEASEKWSGSGKYKRAKRQGAKQLVVLSCTPVFAVQMC